MAKAWYHYYNTPLYQRFITLCNNRQTAYRYCPIAIAVSQ
jgi:hypothetical protein